MLYGKVMWLCFQARMDVGLCCWIGRELYATLVGIC